MDSFYKILVLSATSFYKRAIPQGISLRLTDDTDVRICLTFPATLVFYFMVFLVRLSGFIIVLIKFIIVLTKFIIVLTKFIIVLTKFIIVLTKFIMVLTKFIIVLIKFIKARKIALLTLFYRKRLKKMCKIKILMEISPPQYFMALQVFMRFSFFKN